MIVQIIYHSAETPKNIVQLPDDLYSTLKGIRNEIPVGEMSGHSYLYIYIGYPMRLLKCTAAAFKIKICRTMIGVIRCYIHIYYVTSHTIWI